MRALTQRKHTKPNPKQKTGLTTVEENKQEEDVTGAELQNRQRQA